MKSPVLRRSSDDRVQVATFVSQDKVLQQGKLLGGGGAMKV